MDCIIKFNKYIPYNVLVALNPVLDSTAHHDLLFLAQAIWISQIRWNFEGAAPFSFRYENVSILLVLTVEFCMKAKKKWPKLNSKSNECIVC